jgi:hypothetical protein
LVLPVEPERLSREHDLDLAGVPRNEVELALDDGERHAVRRLGVDREALGAPGDVARKDVALELSLLAELSETRSAPDSPASPRASECSQQESAPRRTESEKAARSCARNRESIGMREVNRHGRVSSDLVRLSDDALPVEFMRGTMPSCHRASEIS